MIHFHVRVVVIRKFNYEELSGIKISWQGLESTIDYAKDFNSYDSHTVSPGLDMILPAKGRASYQDLQFNSHTEYSKTSLALVATKFQANDTDNNQPQTNQAQAAGRFLENDDTYNGCTHCTNPGPDGISCSYRQGTHRLCQQQKTAYQCHQRNDAGCQFSEIL